MAFSPRTSGLVAAALLVGCAGFQAGLAAGMPWGAAAYGGSHPGRVPDRLRVTSAVAVPVYLGIAAVAAGVVGTARVRTVVTGVGAVWLAIGVPVNLASPSLPERALWPPVAAAGAITLWRAVPPSDRRWRGRP